MATDNHTLISTNQIDMDAVTEYVVAKGNLVYRTDASSKNAIDVDEVDGVASSLTATAIDSMHRDTVKNAQQLGGIDAAQYMTTQTGNGLIVKTTDMQDKYQEEICDLKDEVYQLKNQLARGGFIRNDGQYSGFHDLFRANSPVHESADKDTGLICTASTEKVATNNQIQISSDAAFKNLHVHDYIGIKNPIIGEFCVRQIAEKSKDGITITLDRDIETRMHAQTYEIYKSAGIIYDGDFKFANPPDNQLGTNNFYSGVSDDSFNVTQLLQTPNSGYGYNFRIPDNKSGFLVDIELCLQAINNPGDLICYVIDERDLNSFRTPAQAEASYQAAVKANNDTWHFFAKSRPVRITAAVGKQYVKFSFQKNNDAYPLLEEATDITNSTIRYILIVELQDGDTSNYYNMLFLQHRNNDGTLSDLQLNNTTYNYARTKEDSGTPALTTNDTINAMDIFYQVHTIENNKKEPIANNEGLYSAKFYLGKHKKVNSARVSLRIRREGSYAISTTASPSVIGSVPIMITNKDMASGIRRTEDLSLHGDLTKPLELRTGTSDTTLQCPVAIGENSVLINGTTDASVSIADSIMAFNDDPIYRVGYQVAINAYNLTFDKITKQMQLSDPVRYTIPLEKIVRDIQRDDLETSDRLIFHADFTQSEVVDGEIAPQFHDYNYFEVQVYWENKQLSTYPEVRKSQMGAIKEITVSLDKEV